MKIMRHTFWILLGLALPLAAQTPLGTDDADTPDVSFETLRKRKARVEQPINITSNMVGTLSAEPSGRTSTANLTSREKASFFMTTGLEYADEGEFEEAEQTYLRALEVDPDNEEVMFRLGILYVQMERFGDAIGIFEKLIVSDPENPLSHNNIAWCYATGPKVRNVDLALRHSREALLYAPRIPSMWNTLAEAYYIAGEYGKARRSSEQALDLLVSSGQSSEESVRSFQAQLSKIIRAEQAFKMLEGTLDD